MRIYQTTPYNSFGYNKNYHKKLQKYLEKQSKNNPMAVCLLESDKEALRIEDEIVKMEKNKKTNKEEYDNLTFYLQELRKNDAFFMEYNYPEMKFHDNLIKQYLKESKKQVTENAQNWRMNMCEMLSIYSDTYAPLFIHKAEESSKEERPKEENIKEIKPQNEDLVSVANDEDDEDSKNIEQLSTTQDEREQYIEKITKEVSSVLQINPRNEFSPKGFDDVAGMEELKEKLQEELIAYAKNPELAQMDWEDYRIRMPRGYLFYGPPGCGKTFITQALAAESGIDMYKMDIAKLGSKYINQTSNNIDKAFKVLSMLTKHTGKPAILFMDEVDSLVIKRDNAVGNSPENLKATATILKLIESARDNNIIVIAATNKYDLLDDAFKSRLDGQFYFPLPDEGQIKDLLCHTLNLSKKGQNLASDEEKIDELSRILKGYSNRTIVFIIDKASKIAKKDDRRDITFDDMKKVIEAEEFEKVEEKEYGKKKKNKLGFAPA